MFEIGENGKIAFPECWEDDVRMDVLFAPFRPRDVNPENYDSKLKFWKDMIKKYCDSKGSANFSRPELANIFLRNGKVPYCLQAVIENMTLTKEIRLETDFVSDPLNTWKKWAVNTIVKRPLVWGLHLLSPTNTENLDPVYVLLEILQKHCETLELFLQKYRGQVLSLEKLIELKAANLNAEGLMLCLQYLHCLQKVYLHRTAEKNSVVLIKIPNQNEIGQPLTEADLAIYNLELLESKVLNTVQNLEVELKQNDDKVRQYLREGKRSMAKSYLRKKHALETRIEKKHTSLDNIHTLLSQVQEAQTHGEVLNAYKVGSETLKSLLSKPGMNIDSVDEVFTQMKEAMDVHEEVQQSMGTAINDSLDDSVLEEELNALLKPQQVNTTEEKNAVETNTPSIANALSKKILENMLKDDDDEELLAQLENLEIETELPSSSETQVKNVKAPLI